MTSPRPLGRDVQDAGSAALELVVLTPGLLALLLLVLAAGRISAATSQVDTAARDAARAASLERSLAAATTAARGTATASLAEQDVRCRHVTVRVAGNYAAPVGAPAAVRATVACTIDLSDLGLPLPAAKTVDANYTAVLDRYRGR
jgi:Flp pilus assembly protein TadG